METHLSLTRALCFFQSTPFPPTKAQRRRKHSPGSVALSAAVTAEPKAPPVPLARCSAEPFHAPKHGHPGEGRREKWEEREIPEMAPLLHWAGQVTATA